MGQALARGVLVRKGTKSQHQRAVKAATTIQKVARGGALRSRMRVQVTNHAATRITAAARGFLVRNRRFQLVAKTICIQKAYRKWLTNDKKVREKRRQHMLHRKNQAVKLQSHYRHFKERKE